MQVLRKSSNIEWFCSTLTLKLRVWALVMMNAMIVGRSGIDLSR